MQKNPWIIIGLVVIGFVYIILTSSNSGYKSGLDEGYADGYDDGYDDGYNECYIMIDDICGGSATCADYY